MADDMSNNDFGLPFTTPTLSETSKIKKMRFWSIGLFFYPSISQHCFFYQTQILIRINILFPGPPKDCFFRCVSSPCVRKSNFPFEARYFVWNLLTCRKLQNDFGNGPTNVMLFLLPLLWKHLCYLFKKTPDVLERNLCRFRFTWVCLKVVTWISYHNGHKLVISGDNDNDDN